MHISPATHSTYSACPAWPQQRYRQPRKLRETTENLRVVLEETVTRVFDVEIDLMRLPSRGRPKVALARQVGMYLAHVACGLSLTEAGQMFGRDRTTVSHACRVVEERRENSDFDRAVQLLENVTRVLMYTPVR